jgi:phenylacetate-coenzyme A ligase PaaK-like adenylate-forming protein
MIVETFLLEQWLHNKIRQEWQQNESYRSFTGKQALEQITRADVNNFHIFKLRETLAYAYQKSSFYRELFDQNGIEPGKIWGPNDWAKIPFTTPEALRESPHRLLPSVKWAEQSLSPHQVLPGSPRRFPIPKRMSRKWSNLWKWG